MPSGSFSKNARYTSVITNKKNCGGNKKAGLAPRATGPTEFRNVAFDTHPTVNFKVHKGGLPCPENYRNNSGGQCSGGVGALASTRNRGCRNIGNGNGHRRRTTITMAQALAQGGVRGYQDLVITEQSNYDLFNPTDGNIYPYVLGLLISGITFTIAKDATVTILTNINGDEKSASGIIIDNSGKLINHGKIVFSNKYTISGVFTTGIQIINNGEMINSKSGSIDFNTPLKSTTFSCSGIYNVFSKCNNYGNISFSNINSDIGIGTFGFGHRVVNSQCNNYGNISFSNIIGDLISNGCTVVNSEYNNYGKISFSDLIGLNSSGTGLYVIGGQFRNKETGIIMFNGEIKGFYNVTGIISDMFGEEPSLIINDGNISFVKISTTGELIPTGEAIPEGDRDLSVIGQAIGISITDNTILRNRETGTIMFNGEIKGLLLATGIISSNFYIGPSYIINDGNISFVKITTIGEGLAGELIPRGDLKREGDRINRSHVVGDAVGINLFGNTILENRETGTIKFNDNIQGELPMGMSIDAINTLVITNGNITFVNETLIFFPADPTEEPLRILGIGSIKYNNGNNVYYDGHQI